MLIGIIVEILEWYKVRFSEADVDVIFNVHDKFS
mgnify:CR=1 FL=1